MENNNKYLSKIYHTAHVAAKAAVYVSVYSPIISVFVFVLIILSMIISIFVEPFCSMITTLMIVDVFENAIGYLLVGPVLAFIVSIYMLVLINTSTSFGNSIKKSCNSIFVKLHFFSGMFYVTLLCGNTQDSILITTLEKIRNSLFPKISTNK